MKTLHIFIFLSAALCSCVNQKFLSKNQVVFKVESLGNGKGQIKAYHTSGKTIHVSIKDSGDVLLIKKHDSTGSDFILPTIVTTRFNTNSKYDSLAAIGSYYYPETLFPLPGDSNSNHLFITPQRLQYSEDNFVLQLVTTPLKVRPAFTKKRLKDSLSLQALAELNIGASLGLKRTWGVYKAHPYDNGQKARSTSLSGSFFFSLGGTNIKPITIRYYRPYEKTELAVSYGATILFGFNSINIGLSAGTDHLFDRNIGKRWIYDGSLWYGITLAYDIVK